MTPRIIFAAAALATLVAAPAFANDQLARSAGLTPAQAEGLTLNQITAAKYNRGRSYSDRQAVVIASGDAGVSAQELNAFAVDSYNSGKTTTDRQPAAGTGDQAFAFVSTRSAADPDRHAQLIASAGLTPAQAEGLTLDEIVSAKYNKDVSFADRQRVGNNY